MTHFAGYLAERRFFGATVGRYANRIANGRLSLDGETVRLAANNGRHALHGGPDGFDRKLWQITEIEGGARARGHAGLCQPDGEEGYPGRLDVRVTYRVTGPSELSLSFMEARTDRPTIVNLTNHSFFNLEGATSGTHILDHKLTVAAEHFLAIDPDAIPLPEAPRSVAGTPFDFREPSAPSARASATSDQQLRNGRGYDHNLLSRRVHGKLRLAARLEAPRSGRIMELLTDQPGLQVYSGNYLDGTIAGKRRQALPAVGRDVPGAADLAGCAEPAGFSEPAPRTGRASIATTPSIVSVQPARAAERHDGTGADFHSVSRALPSGRRADL